MSNKPKKQKEEKKTFEVEKILDKQVDKDGVELFFIQWKGFPASENSWVPRTNIHCLEMLNEFEKNFQKGGAVKRVASTDEEQAGPSPKRSKPSTSSAPEPSAGPSTSATPPVPLDVKKLKRICGIKNVREEGQPAVLCFLCEYDDETFDFVPREVINKSHPQIAIKYYESKLTSQ